MTPPAAAPAAAGLFEIGQICVNIKDVDRAVAFYRDSLGIPFLFQAPPGLAFFQCGAVRIMLSLPETPEYDHPSSVLYFNVRDIAGIHQTLVKRGVRFEGEPHIVHRGPGFELWMGFFKDTEGNTLALMEQKAG